MFKRLQSPFVWEENLLQTIHRQWSVWPTVNAAAMVIARWTPIVMVALVVLAGMGFGLTPAFVTAGLRSSMAAVLAAVMARLLNEPVSRHIARPRPFEQLGLTPLVGHDRGKGFPSNHATGAFCLAIAMGGVPAYAPILFVLAVLLSISRVYTGLHYPSDVVAGALHGTFAAGLVLWLSAHILPWWPLS